MSNTQASSKMISLVPTNGTEFDCQQGQKIIMELPPNLGLVSGRQSHFALDICNTSSDNKRLRLDNMAGADSVISRIDIYSLATGTHLETLQNYNQWSAINHQYLYEDKTNLQVLEGCGSSVYAYDTGAAEVTATTATPDAVISPIKTDGTHYYNFRRFTTPLKSGVFRWWDDDKLVPVLALGGGIRMEVTLENPKIALHYFKSKNGAGTKYDIGPSSTTGVPIPNGQAGANIQSTDDFASVEDSGFAVGNLVKLTSSAADVDTSITAIAIVGNKLQWTLADAVPNDGRTGMELKLRNDTRSCLVRPQFRVLSIAPPQEVIAKMGNGFKYEFTSYDLHTSTLLASASRHQVELNSVATKAVCIMSSFHNTSKFEEDNSSSYFTGATPNLTDLTGVQYFLNNRLAPVRQYNPQLLNDKVIAMNETVKAFDSVSREAQDLGNDDGGNMAAYTNTFLISRQLAKRPFYYDLKEAEGQIRLQFKNTPTRTQPFQINTFVWSKKVVDIARDGNIEVEL